jgi:hypothetical protein
MRRVSRTDLIPSMRQSAGCLYSCVGPIPMDVFRPAKYRRRILCLPDTILLKRPKDNIELCEQSLKSSTETTVHSRPIHGSFTPAALGVTAPGNINTACTPQVRPYYGHRNDRLGMTDSAVIWGRTLLQARIFRLFGPEGDVAIRQPSI